jgi:hypothetical protein
MKIQFNSKIKAVVLSLIALSGLAAISYSSIKSGSFTPPEGAPMAEKNVTYSKSTMLKGKSESTAVGGPGMKNVTVSTVYMPGTTEGTGSVTTTHALTETHGLTTNTLATETTTYTKEENNGGVTVQNSSSGTFTGKQKELEKKAEPYMAVTTGRQFVQEKTTVTGETTQTVEQSMETTAEKMGVSQNKIEEAKTTNSKIQTGVDYAINNPNSK